jgi:hypothetical protein
MSVHNMKGHGVRNQRFGWKGQSVANGREELRFLFAGQFADMQWWGVAE